MVKTNNFNSNTENRVLPILNSLKGYKIIPKFVLFLVTIVSLATLFYWFELRPSQIRQKCYAFTLEKRDEKINTNNRLSNEEANNYYRRCFAENGLRPEDLVK